MRKERWTFLRLQCGEKDVEREGGSQSQRRRSFTNHGCTGSRQAHAAASALTAPLGLWEELFLQASLHLPEVVGTI